jgi:NADPH:quinone reductase-like Zn-dependent oxidoreductase
MAQQLVMRVDVVRRGGPEVLQVVEEPVAPKPQPGEVRLRMLAAGISAYDRMERSRWFPGFPRPPYTPGLDVVGVVDALGAGVTEPTLGSVVAGGPYAQGGCYASYLCRPAEGLVPVPDGVDPVEAVCLVTDYLTARHVLHDTAHARPGERALVQGAAGGVGTALLQLGALAGLQLYGTASAHNHDLVSRLGATPIDYRTQDVAARIQELTGDGVDVVFDPIGGAAQLRQSYRCLRQGGRLVWFGVAAIARRGARVIPESLLTRLLLDLRRDGKHAPMTTDEPPEAQRRHLAELLGLLAAGDLRPVVADRIPLRGASRAHVLLDHGGHAGKVVLVPTT